MIPITLCAVAFGATLVASRRSLGLGLAALMTAGYAYGIIRANLLSIPTHLLYDCAVLGLYAGVLPRVGSRLWLTGRHHALALWTAALIGWPLILFLVPGYDPALQAIGLRGNAFLLPFLLIGAMLTGDDLRTLAVWLAALNICVLAVAVLQYQTDVRLFFPRNQVSQIIHASKDLIGYSAYRIPASFVNAHAYAGTMVVTLPLLIGVFTLRQTAWWKGLLGYCGISAALAGVFLGAARTPSAVLFLLVAVVTLAGGLKQRGAVAWVAVLLVVGGFVLSNQRLQRFTQLQSWELIRTRISWSVNDQVLDTMSAYPLGNGLAGGGTSVPYFIQSDAADIVPVENEYARIAVEQGTPGLVLWIGFIVWFVTRPQVRRTDDWFLGRLGAWVVVTASLATALLGNGLLTSIPQSSLFLLWIGWTATPESLSAPVLAHAVGTPLRSGWRQRSSLPSEAAG